MFVVTLGEIIEAIVVTIGVIIAVILIMAHKAVDKDKKV